VTVRVHDEASLRIENAHKWTVSSSACAWGLPDCQVCAPRSISRTTEEPPAGELPRTRTRLTILRSPCHRVGEGIISCRPEDLGDVSIFARRRSRRRVVGLLRLTADLSHQNRSCRFGYP